MKSRRTMRAEAIASFESSILQRDSLDAEIERVGRQFAELKYQRDHLSTSIETVCRLLNWSPEVAEAGFRKRLANDGPSGSGGADAPPALSMLPLMEGNGQA